MQKTWKNGNNGSSAKPYLTTTVVEDEEDESGEDRTLVQEAECMVGGEETLIVSG